MLLQSKSLTGAPPRQQLLWMQQLGPGRWFSHCLSLPGLDSALQKQESWWELWELGTQLSQTGWGSRGHSTLCPTATLSPQHCSWAPGSALRCKRHELESSAAGKAQTFPNPEVCKYHNATVVIAITRAPGVGTGPRGQVQEDGSGSQVAAAVVPAGQRLLQALSTVQTQLLLHRASAPHTEPGTERWAPSPEPPAALSPRCS